MHFAKSLLFAALALVALNQVSALKCYSCVTYGNDVCTNTEECYSGTECGKFDISLRDPIGNTHYGAIRKCLPMRSCETTNSYRNSFVQNQVQNIGGGEAIVTSCHTCNTYLCNSSTHLDASLWCILLSGVMFLFAKV